MEVKYLRLIKTIAEEGSIASSSEKLFLTQSALSHQLRDIEDRLGFKVFLRQRSKWKLTSEGQELYKTANQVLDAIDKGLENIKHIRTGSKGTVRISTECYTFYQGIPAFLQRMAVMYPDIKTELKLEATHRPISKILANEIDIALVTAKPQSKELVSREVFQDEVFALKHKEHELAAKPWLDADDFSKTPLIIHSYPMETVAVYKDFLAPQGIEPPNIIAMPMTGIMIELVNANQGITCMPKWAIEQFKLPPDLVFKQIGPNGLKRSHYLVARKSDESKTFIADFIANFEDAFGE